MKYNHKWLLIFYAAFSIFFSFEIHADYCSDILSKFFIKAKTESLSLSDFSQSPIKYQKLNTQISKVFKRKARQLKLSKKHIKGLTSEDKEKYLLMLGVTFSENSKGQFKKKFNDESVDKIKMALFSQLKDRKIDIKNINEIVFKYPEDEQKKILRILDMNVKKSTQSKGSKAYLNILYELSKDNGSQIYNSTIWNFMAHDWSSPIESAVKHYMNKALQNSKIGESIKSRLDMIEETIMKEIEKAIDKMPGDTASKKRFKKFLKMYLSLAAVCKAINFTEILKGVANDMNSIVGNIPDPTALKKALKQMKEVTLSEIKDSVKDFLPSRNGYKNGVGDIVSIMESSYSGIKNGLLTIKCPDQIADVYSEYADPLESTKKKANEIANVFGGKHLHDLFKANRFQFSKSDCKEMYIEQSKKVVSAIANLIFIEKMEDNINKDKEMKK